MNLIPDLRNKVESEMRLAEIHAKRAEEILRGGECEFVWRQAKTAINAIIAVRYCCAPNYKLLVSERKAKMTFDDLVNTLRLEHQNMSNCLVDLDEATTGLCQPGGTMKEVRHALWALLECYMRAGFALENFTDTHPEWNDYSD